ncbi:hypothetical protein GCM10027187_60480 [Streptosporangium sandarakinum]|uniref:Uncharacterized protein n=1 Tax=Streptosporangium sandarakinum TaxID=1260955 RepID=A0A852UTI4_9ACTN|nr:hypothetical protein [Streptosporangium sandarakinum]NYF39529.1 hypothetical protein [Streptosporangium sandarakinum]
MRMNDPQEGSGRLVELAWELNDLGFDSIVRLPPGRRPSMEVFLPLGRPRPVTAQHGRTVTFTWPGVPDRWTRSRPDHDEPDDLLPDPARRSRMRELAARLAEVVR